MKATSMAPASRQVLERMQETIEDTNSGLLLSAKTLARPLAAAMTLVVGAGVGVELLKDRFQLDAHSGVVPVFSLSYEWNVPTLYTAWLLVVCSMALTLVAASVRKARERFFRHWCLLAVGFAYIALDEMLEIHEHADALVNLNHIVYFDWVIPAAVLVLGLGMLFVPFLRALPSRDRNRFVLAGAIYVGGAVGMDIPLGSWTSRHGVDNLGYALIDALGESLEMLGLNIFLLGLLDHLALRGVSLRFAPETASVAQGVGGESSEASSARGTPS